MSQRIIYGVWEHFWETNDLIGLYWTREEAEAKAKSGGTYQSLDYMGMERWNVEEHLIAWPPPKAAIIKP